MLQICYRIRTALDLVFLALSGHSDVRAVDDSDRFMHAHVQVRDFSIMASLVSMLTSLQKIVAEIRNKSHQFSESAGNNSGEADDFRASNERSEAIASMAVAVEAIA